MQIKDFIHQASMLLICFAFIGLSSCDAQNAHSTGKGLNSKGLQSENDKVTNHLAGESSPYLLQHAYNPVDWYPWKDEALALASKEDKLMVISIGYAACHWCHVMEHESFEDEEVAGYMNNSFISIKVDREERPDVDNVYMTACQIVTQWQGGGSCGWPLNVIALPDGRPIFAGTYYPKDTWIKILEHFGNLYQEDRPALEDMASQLTAAIESTEEIETVKESVDFGVELLDDLFPLWEERMDFVDGGRSGAPKFPMPINYQYLMRYHYLNDNPRAMEAVEVSLRKMAEGGIYDHAGGGFARYSTDAKWLVPHFEKMLYDNGQLMTLYAEAYRHEANPLYEKVMRETLDFVARELTDPSGGFYSSLDADSEGEEGKFYVWTSQEIDSLVGAAFGVSAASSDGSSAAGSATASAVLKDFTSEEATKLFSKYYNIQKNGNWEHGKNILHVKKQLANFAEKEKKSLTQMEAIMSVGKAALMAERGKRIRPLLDDKVLTSWNALMQKGYLEVYMALGDENYLEAALKNARFLEREMLQSDFRLLRNYKDGKAVINAFLDDYALLIDAWISLYQVTFDEHWLINAQRLTDYTIAHFSDEDGMFFFTSDLDAALISRKKELNDNVIPASNSVMARNLLKLGNYFARKDYLDRAKSMGATMEPQVRAYPFYNANWAMLLAELAHPPFEVAIVGKKFEQSAKDFHGRFLPDVLLLGSAKTGDLSLLENKYVKGQTTIYVCRDKVCKLPVTESAEALQQLTNW